MLNIYMAHAHTLDPIEPPNTLDILYVEDDEEDARILCRNFENEKTSSYQITHSATFTDALMKLKEKKFGAILLDLNLPDGRGLNGIEDIKDIYPDLPVVIITGYDDESMAIEALQKGAQEYIVKAHINNNIIKRVLQSSILRKRVEQTLKHKAYTDPLTGLANRISFEQTASKMIERATRWNEKEAMLFIDLNKFKEINDTYGHEAGNAVLIETGNRLKQTLRKSDMIARYAGDEFICYLDSKRDTPIDEETCRSVAQKIVNAVEQPIEFEGRQLKISLSIGIAIFPDAGKSFNELLKKADIAMYQAKKNPNQKFCFVDNIREADMKEAENISNQIDEWRQIINMPNQILSNENAHLQDLGIDDITLFDLEALKNKYDKKFSEFAFMAAHDLRAPVRKIITFSELLDSQYDDLSNDEKNHFLKRLSLSGKRINRLIDGLLVFAGVVKNTDSLEKICLTEMTEEILDDLKIWLKEHNTTVQVETLPKLLVYKNDVRQILYHLILNAVTYKKENQECKIKIYAENNIDKDNQSCVICLSDNGIGIAPEHQPQIFKPFKRLHSADQIEGNGLGLSICDRAIKKHGGKIWVESKANEGAIFKFIFPIKN